MLVLLPTFYGYFLTTAKMANSFDRDQPYYLQILKYLL